ncbi:hypothetical protein Ddye_009702 [Dipteronia dyeriana]|uniref:Pentatricopeptide repeat-containing protein n=1 Tax=Dipteronia dyeriana TaxID=168575 RepID=A0AAE0CMG5_9ROSI|nr:hypothetical protein Ddye_009702 [Dipteronia dyeriana]
MSTQKFIRAIHPPTNSHQQTASIIAQVLRFSRVEFLKNIPLLLSNHNSHVIQLVFSNPRLPLSSFLDFFYFLSENPVNKPDLVTHLTHIRRLYDVGKFTDGQFVLNCIASDVNLRTSVLNIVSLVEDGTVDPIFVEKLSGMLFSVYADNGMFEEAIGVFDYMENIGFKIRGRCCVLLLLALNRFDKMDMSFSFFRRMVGASVEITVFSVTIVIDGLCKRGEVEKAKDLMEEMVTRGIKPNVVTYSTLINGYCINGMVDEALKVKATMEHKGFEPDVVTYNTIAGGLCKLKRFRKAKSWLFTVMERGLTPSMSTFNTLIAIVTEERNLEKSKLFKWMERRGVRPNIFTYNSLIDGYQKKGNLEEAKRLFEEMEKL